jgi:uncharacterized damage-inducible protein DinB
MATLSPLIEAWDEAYREFAIAMGGLSDEDLWKRPHPRLLSVGELAGHIAYGQAIWVFGDGSNRPNPEQLPIRSPLIDHAYRYYTSMVEHASPQTPNTQHPTPPLNATQVLEEVLRIHEAAKAAVAGKGLEDPCPSHWRTWGNLVQYQVFHVAYHTGQVYSVRHLLGHETEDN